MNPTLAFRATAQTHTFRRSMLCALSLAAALGLAACGGGDDTAGTTTGTGAPPGGTTTPGGGTTSDTGLVFTGTNNSARTGFTPPADATTCLAIKTTFIQVNCLKPGTPAGTTDDVMITFAVPLVVGSVANLASGGSSTVEFMTTELAGITLVTKFWSAQPTGTVTLTAIDSKSVTFKLAGIALKADTLSGGSASTGVILADGSVTVTLK